MTVTPHCDGHLAGHTFIWDPSKGQADSGCQFKKNITNNNSTLSLENLAGKFSQLLTTHFKFVGSMYIQYVISSFNKIYLCLRKCRANSLGWFSQ